MKELNQAQLEHTLHQRLNTQIAQYRVSGAQLLVCQHGHPVCTICAGYQDVRTGEPLRQDALYRLASMTKPVTGVAALIAMEKGWFSPSDPVSLYFPAYGEMKLAVLDHGSVVPGETSQTPLRIWHLLSHCNGILAQTPLGELLIDAAPRAAYASIGDMVNFCATQPLAFEPEHFTAYTGYASFDILARIIEMKSGLPYAKFLEQNIFAPLGLRDLTYQPDEAQWQRMITMSDRMDGGGFAAVELGKHTFESFPLEYTSGGAGLAGTLHDYGIFAQMLLNRGEHQGVRLFSPELLDEMTRPRVADHIPGRDPISSWGFGVRVVVADGVLPVGSFGWSGAYGTHFWVDPENEIIAVYLRNSRWYDSHGCGEIGQQFERDVMSCLE